MSRGLLSPRKAWWCVALAVVGATPALAFPPYRSTDADTADPYALEVRLGLVKWQREGGEDEVVTPLLRANLGLPSKLELIAEFEYLPKDESFADGAVGFKWVPLFGGVSFGIETLALMPVRRDDSGVGVESQLVATLWRDEFRVHVNAGGFHDDRPSQSESGWRASTLVEFPRGRVRPGLEIFAKQANGEEVDMRLGGGVIVGLGRFDVRSGLHLGLTDAAPDVVFNLWIATKLSLR